MLASVKSKTQCPLLVIKGKCLCPLSVFSSLVNFLFFILFLLMCVPLQAIQFLTTMPWSLLFCWAKLYCLVWTLLKASSLCSLATMCLDLNTQTRPAGLWNLYKGVYDSFLLLVL